MMVADAVAAAAAAVGMMVVVVVVVAAVVEMQDPPLNVMRFLSHVKHQFLWILLN